MNYIYLEEIMDKAVVTAHVVGKHLCSEEFIGFVVAVLWDTKYGKKMDKKI